MALSDALKGLEQAAKMAKTTQSVKGTYKPNVKPIPPLAKKSTPRKAQEVEGFKPVEKQAISALPINKNKTTAPAYGTKGSLKTAKGENIKPVVNPYAVGLTKVASFGTSSLLPGMKQAEEQAQTQFPKSYLAGQVLGYAAPTGLVTKLTKGLVKGATSKLGSGLANRVAEGAIVGTTAEATQVVKPLVTKEITPKQAGTQLATGLIAGAGIDVGLGVIGKVFKSLPKSTLSKVKTGATLSTSEKANIVKELGLPEGTTADDYIKQMQNLAKSEDIVSIPKQRKSDQVEQYYKSLEKDDGLVKPSVSETPIKSSKTDYGYTREGVDYTKEGFPIIKTKGVKDKPPSQATEVPTSVVKPLVKQTPTKQIKSVASEIEKPTGVSEKLTIPVEEQENFRRTIHNSLMKSELPDDLKKAYEETPSVYQKANNEEDWAKAWDKVSKNYEGSKTALRSKDALESADDTMEYIALLQQASKINITEAKQLADDFAEKGTKAGQAIQAIIALQKTTPEGQLVRASQTIKGVEDAFKNSNPTGAKEYEQAKKEIEKAIKENKPLTEVEQLASKYKVKFKAKVEKNYENLLTALKEKYKLPSLSDEEAKQIVDLMEQGNKETGRKQELLFAKVDQLISDKVPPTLWDKIKALRNMSLLGNIKTIGIRNPLGNLIFTGLENVQQIPSGITDKMVSAILKTPRYTKVLPDLRTQAKGLKKGVSEAWEDVLNNVDTSPTRGGAELPRNRKVFETAWLNKANNWLGDALKFGDRPFYQAAYDARLKELMDLQPNAKKEDLEKLAKEFGLERTFQNNSTTSQAMGMIKRGLNLNKDFGLGDIAMPYTQTPSNILEKGVQYTPLNLVNIGSKLFGQATGKETIRNNPKAFSDAVGRMFTGSGAIALGYKLASEGMISGTQKEDSPKEKAIKKQVGEQQYSIKIGDKWYSFDWAQPASIPLAIGADMYLAGEDKETTLAKIQAGIESGLETVFTQGVTQGITRMFGGSTVTSGVTETAAGLPTQFIPTLSGQAAQQSDVYKRDVDYSSIPSQVKTTAMKKIPVIREQLPASLDLFGQPIKEQSGREGIVKALSVFISPTNISTETSDKLSKELYNLYKRTGETDVIPSKLPDGLTTKQKYEFKQKFGNEVRTRLERTMVGAYNTYTDERKIKAVRSAIDSAYEKTKKEMKIGK